MSREDETASTTSAADASPVGLDAISLIVNDLRARQAAAGYKWMLISPDGKVYIGDPQGLIFTLYGLDKR